MLSDCLERMPKKRQVFNSCFTTKTEDQIPFSNIIDSYSSTGKGGDRGGWVWFHQDCYMSVMTTCDDWLLVQSIIQLWSITSNFDILGVAIEPASHLTWYAFKEWWENTEICNYTFNFPHNLFFIFSASFFFSFFVISFDFFPFLKKRLSLALRSVHLWKGWGGG